MSFVSSSDTITIKAYLTKKGKQHYFSGDDKDIIVKYITFGDDDANYFISSSIKLDDKPNRLSTGFIPDLSGDDERCIYNLANGVDIKNKIRISSYKKGDIVNQFCQPPYTLIQEISNGDGTTYFNKIENSIECGFSYKSNIFSRSFIKQTCTGSSIGQSYTVTTTYGQFTGLTQSDADNKALNYLNVSGQTIANNLGSCLFASTPQERTFEKNDCPNGGRPYVVTTNSGQFTSLISENDANNKALIWLDTNGQLIANQNGQCRLLVTSDYIIRYNSGDFTTRNTPRQDLLTFTINQNNQLSVVPSIINVNDVQGNFIINNTNFYNKNIKLVFTTKNFIRPQNNNTVYITTLNNNITLQNNIINNLNGDFVVEIFVNNYQQNDVINYLIDNTLGDATWDRDLLRTIEIYEKIDIYQ